MKKIAVLLLMAVMAFGADFKVDTKASSLDFEATQMLFSKVDGNFSDFSGTITTDGDRVTAINGEVAVISLYTGIARRDDHLLSSDFFYEVKFKKIFFRSIKVTKDSVEAAVTIKDITKNVIFKLKKAEVNEDGAKIELSGVVDRTEFDLDNSFMSATIKNDIKIKATLIAR